MSLHDVTLRRPDPHLALMAAFFNYRWGDADTTYEVTGDTITEWRPRTAHSIAPDSIEHWATTAEFNTWRRNNHR